MKRREVYATTGSRITVRFFGGFDFTVRDLDRADFAGHGYAAGLPMGGDLHAPSDRQAPTFLAHALCDANGATLDSIQIIKGWHDSQGKVHERVYDIVEKNRTQFDRAIKNNHPIIKSKIGKLKMFKPLIMSIAAPMLLNVSCVDVLASGLPNARADRIEARIFALGEFGKNADGGVDRTAYSDADIAGRSYMMGLMKTAGLEVSIDYAGNIIGKRAGKNSALAPIMFGSHIDSVPGGGNYDGDVGVIGALEAVELLNSTGITTEHPLEMVIFADEEGGTVGSMALAGILSPDAMNDISNSGFKRSEGVDRIGGDHTRLREAKRATPIHAFVELHIEQGGFLEEKGLDIGIVEGIVGIRWWTLTVEGVANHGGTTPMPGRKDALVAASRLVIAINELATNMEGRQVATVGKIQAFPGAPNVIPGKVELSLEIRDLDADKIQRVYELVQQEAKAVEKAAGVKITFERSNVDIHPAPTHITLRSLIEQSTKDLGLTYQNMPSGAGHDAQDMATITPTGMIFVPSRGGISHSPKEYTSPQDMANGADVLLRTLLKLDETKF